VYLIFLFFLFKTKINNHVLGKMGGLQKVWTVYVPWDDPSPSKAFITQRAAYKYAFDRVYNNLKWYQDTGLLSPQQRPEFDKMCDYYVKNVQAVLTMPESALERLFSLLNNYDCVLRPAIARLCRVIECDIAE
jgi:hypothetical protein